MIAWVSGSVIMVVSQFVVAGMVPSILYSELKLSLLVKSFSTSTACLGYFVYDMTYQAVFRPILGFPASPPSAHFGYVASPMTSPICLVTSL